MGRNICQACGVNEIAGPSQLLQQRDGPGLLAQYGIIVEGAPEALDTLRRLLRGKPIGEALVLIAEQGRHYGLRLFSSPLFDEQLFLKDAGRFGMDGEQAICFVRNLTPRLAPADAPCLDRSVAQKRLPG